MSYIINNASAFVNIKLTEDGRQKLAQGKLNFNSWGIGDSEINYDRESTNDNNQGDVSLSGYSRVLRPFDRQPNIKYPISSNTTVNGLNTLTTSQINTIKAIVNNKAEDRGFFDKDNTTYTTLSGSSYIKDSGIINSSEINGTNTLIIGDGINYEVGDMLLLKLSNDTVGTLDDFSNTIPVPNLWFKIQSKSTTNTLDDTVTLDRDLPNNGSTSSTSQFIIYTGDDITNGFGFEESTPYWNTNTLSFAANCDVSCGDIPIWNMNTVWSENLAGMTQTGINTSPTTPNESYEKFGSNDFLGQKYPYFEYKSVPTDSTVQLNECGVPELPGQSIIDPTKKSISILHYTNNTISNFYGEFLYINDDNDKNVRLRLPDLMYHRRDFSTEEGVVMGMDFVTSGTVSTVGVSDIEYVNLYEDSTMVSDEPRIVGRVFPQLKTIIFDDDEIIAAMSYKSNRNWTLPPLSSTLVSSSAGSNGGMLGINDTIYISYTFENTSGNGLMTTLPCQYYTKLTNNTTTTKDVLFKLDDIDLLPYMRKEEKGTYDGMGFSAKEFKVIYQVVSDINERPSSDGWKRADFTSTNITSSVGESIDPKLLENQNPLVNGFLIDTNTTTTTFDIIESLNMATNSSPDSLQFGDERFFYGNVETYIGASIFKTVFNINISGDQFKISSNPTRLNSDSNPPDIRVTEVGIYDDTNTLVMVGKLSKPVKLTSGNTIMIELSIDF